MKIRVIASTKEGYTMPKEEAILFSGKSAGICYLPDTVDTLWAEPEEKTLRRAKTNVEAGHHSVFGHVTYNLILEEAPKILAMILNNEQAFNASEKSARYTIMNCTDLKERKLYEKWTDIFEKRILEVYSYIGKRKARRLAQENARYLISVFTPATSMEYTVSFQQLNYIIYWAKDYIKNMPNNPFSIKVKKVLEDFLKAMPNLEIEGLTPENKGRHFSLFATRKRRTEFGENYSTCYLASFAELAQVQRHRRVSYEMLLPEEKWFYVPFIIQDTEYEDEWYEDIKSLEENYPQGMLVWVNERGTLENFILKCTDRLCGSVQLETMLQTEETLKKYMLAAEKKPEILEYLKPYSKGACCTFPGFVCKSPCVFGPKNALTRKI